MADAKLPGGQAPRWLLAVVVCAAAWGVYSAVGRDADVDKIAGRFFRDLRDGDVADAYARLSRRRREVMTLEQFEALTNHPALRNNVAADFDRKTSHSDGLCSLGTLKTSEGMWTVEVYVVEEGDRWRLESFAIQPPATMSLGTMLPECGYWEGTRVGYSGPAIARSTRPVDE